MSEEIWKDIKGYEGLYQVSNLGRIKALSVDVKQDGIQEKYQRKFILLRLILTAIQ